MNLENIVQEKIAPRLTNNYPRDKSHKARATKKMISVVIPTYNAERTIEESLEAITNQTLSSNEYEVIVVDDGSTDSTLRLAKKYPVLIIEQKHMGAAVARNTGVKSAKGEIIVFTDSDCVPEPDWVAEMVSPIRGNGIAGVKGAYRTRQKKLLARFSQIEFEDRYEKLRHYEYIDFVDSHAAAFTKEAFLSVGGFNPTFPVASNEDVDLSYKLAERGYQMVFNPDAVVYHYHPDTLWKYLRLKFWRGYWRMAAYRLHPKKVISDSYTPQMLKFQILLSFLTFGLIFSCFWNVKSLLGIPILLLAFLLTSIPFSYRAYKSDKMVGFVSPGLLYLRSLTFIVGIAAGLLSQKKKEVLIPFLLLVSDIIACNLAFWCAYGIRIWLSDSGVMEFYHTIEPYQPAAFVVTMVWLLVFFGMGLYKQKRTYAGLDDTINVFKALCVVMLILMSGAYLVKFDYSRIIVGGFVILALFYVVITRYIIRKIQWSLLKHGYNVNRVLILGTGPTANTLAHKMINFPNLGYKLVGFASTNGKDGKAYQDYPILGNKDDILDIIRKEHIDEIFVADSDLSHEKILSLVVECEDAPVGFRIVSDFLEIFTSATNIDSIADIPLIDLRYRQMGWWQRLIKRLFDLAISASFFIISLPLWILIVIAIRLDSSGSALFQHKRVGKNGKIFKMYKFRSMYKDVDKYQLAPNERTDERITRVGRILRRTSLDELPQLLNVIFGDMSFVGPRPEMPFIVKEYQKWQMKRLEVKPGITGLWQILGRKDLPLHENLEYDFYYIKNQSLLLDLTIMLKTIPTVIRGRGAY